MAWARSLAGKSTRSTERNIARAASPLRVFSSSLWQQDAIVGSS